MKDRRQYVYIYIILYAVLLVGATPRQGNYAMPQRTIVSWFLIFFEILRSVIFIPEQLSAYQ